jgi:nucleoid-associated protein YgaU
MNSEKRERVAATDDRATTKTAPREASGAPLGSGPRMSLEKKLGIAFIACLFSVFCIVLTMRLTNYGESNERVDIDLSQSTERIPGNMLPTPEPPRPTVLAERSDGRSSVAFNQTMPPKNGGMPGYAAPPPGSPPPSMPMPGGPGAPPQFGGAPSSPANAASPYGGARPAVGGGPSSGDRYAVAAPANPAPRSVSLEPPQTPVTPPVVSLPSTPVPVNTPNPMRSVAASSTTTSAPPASPYATPASPPAPTAAAAMPAPPTSGTSSPSTPPSTNPYAVASSPRTNTASLAPPSFASSTAAVPAAPNSVAVSSSPAPSSAPVVPPSPSPYGESREPRAIDPGAAAAQPLARAAAVATPVAAANALPAASTADRYAVPAAATPPAAPAQSGSSQGYVVQANDSFWSIAEKVYGDGAYYRALFAYNSDRYPHAEDVRVGSVLDVPSAAVLKQKYPELISGSPSPVATVAAVSATQPPRAVTSSGARTYVVQPGDTLFDIARRQLGKASYWSEIYNLNKAALGESLDQLRPGTEIVLPNVGTN